MNELFQFCKNSKIFPDILTAFELKRCAAKITGEKASSLPNINYSQFERLVRDISIKCFSPSLAQSDRIRLLFVHIRNPI